ncbi:glycosyltransferase family A protein [Rhizobium sp. GN54]|uniref:glycosyltransferase family A protein n=1 Tax=Rhizobium sp. GN54 TaxID=2898150 RepID=UPI001E63370C|nr:glycosyltransferase family A protein [Rhizobium sp. GN54]MCD2183558.1 glycosyltransferase [Rhizobium sp. GN54]
MSKRRLSALRKSGLFSSEWYLEAYPDVAMLGMDSAEHYLRFGAEMGRNPSRNFDTNFYLETYPDVRESGMNPLLHFARIGRHEGRLYKKVNLEADASIVKPNHSRQRLTNLGFYDEPVRDLYHALKDSRSAQIRAAAARELSLWSMRLGTPSGYREALKHVRIARFEDVRGGLRKQLATIELMCLYHLGEFEEGRKVFESAAAAGELSADGILAWANFQPDAPSRLAQINSALEHFGIPVVCLNSDERLLPYDRLTIAAPHELATISDGPKVTVLMAVYNAADTIATAIRSLFEQTWKNLEIIVIDDCSTDETRAIAEDFARDEPRIQVISMPENGGAYIARNRGIEQATGEYVTLHDADDWSHPLKIERQVRFLMENPDRFGCNSQQARSLSDLRFHRWVGVSGFIITNTSSFMFRREPMRNCLGYWDTVRFSADNELIRRAQRVFGEEAVQKLATGPLSFQRDSETSIIADDVLGMSGGMFGARRQYREAQSLWHEKADGLRYDGDKKRSPFPTPAIMRSGKAGAETRHYQVITVSDFRIPGGSTRSCTEEIWAQANAGMQTAVFPMYQYEYLPVSAAIQPEIWNAARSDKVDILSYGERATCDLLILRSPAILQHRQRYLPTIDAQFIKVIIDKLPMNESVADAASYDFGRCCEHIRQQFRSDAEWHPSNPLIRATLNTLHRDQIDGIRLADDDWREIIDLDGRGEAPVFHADNLVTSRNTAADAADLLPTEAPSMADVYVDLSREAELGSRERTAIEAMAAGIPVILPECWRPVFDDAALYAAEDTVADVVLALREDRERYDAQAEIARRHLRENFGHSAHISRLAKVGVVH